MSFEHYEEEHGLDGATLLEAARSEASQTEGSGANGQGGNGGSHSAAVVADSEAVDRHN